MSADIANEFYLSMSADPGFEKRISVVMARDIENQLVADGWQAGRRISDVSWQLGSKKAGRAATREALRLLQARDVIHLQRGATGGIFTALPETDRLLVACAEYFRSNQIEVGLIIDADRVLSAMGARCADPGGKAFLDTLRLVLVRAIDEAGLPLSGRRLGWHCRNLSEQLASDILTHLQCREANCASEDDLCDALNVSRELCRQAVRILEDRGFVHCRRGRGLGVALSRLGPGVAVRQSFSVFVRQGLSLGNCKDFMEDLNIILVGRAAQSIRQRQSGRIAQLQSALQSETIDFGVSGRTFDFLYDASSSPVLGLVQRMLCAYAARISSLSTPIAFHDGHRVARDKLTDILDLVMAGQADRACEAQLNFHNLFKRLT